MLSDITSSPPVDDPDEEEEDEEDEVEAEDDEDRDEERLVLRRGGVVPMSDGDFEDCLAWCPPADVVAVDLMPQTGRTDRDFAKGKN